MHIFSDEWEMLSAAYSFSKLGKHSLSPEVHPQMSPCTGKCLINICMFPGLLLTDNVNVSMLYPDLFLCITIVRLYFENRRGAFTQIWGSSILH